MIPVLSATQVRDADARTIASGVITSIDLMERAASRCAEIILAEVQKGSFGNETPRFLAVTGMGNNGGDGLVIARVLHAAGAEVRVVRILHKPEPSTDHAINWKRLIAKGIPVMDLDEHSVDRLSIAEDEVVIDALLGTGLNSAVAGPLGLAVDRLNTSGCPIIAIDMPSGLFAADNDENDPGKIVHASITLTFEAPKLAQLLPENSRFIGELRVVPIGLDQGVIDSFNTPYHLIEVHDVIDLLPSRPNAGHKGTFGHVLLVAGSKGKYGAAVLCTRAALRSGVGLVTTHVPEEAVPVMQSVAPEAMCSWDRSKDHVTELPRNVNWTAIGIGPGLGMEEHTQQMVKRAIQDAAVPLVLDADALNALAEHPTWSAFLPRNTVLTPHPGEFDRLCGDPAHSGYQRLEAARQFAMKNGVILVLKGAWTAVCNTDGHVFFNPTGNPGMAKGGSGDALTGLLAGLIGQGVPALAAALIATYLHGSAGDLAAEQIGMDGMTPSDLIEALPAAWMALRNGSKKTLQ